MLGVDVGGTFTDVVGVKDGRIEVTKVPSDVANPEVAVVKGVEILGGEGRKTFNHASTVGLNSIITRRLPKLAFLATEGHRDILDFGRCWRPLEGQTDPHWRRSFGDAARPLVERYLRRGIRERKDAQGRTLMPLDEDQARHELEILKRCEIDGVAICLLNSYVDPEHERRLRELVREVLGDVSCSISSDVSPLAKEYARASTTVVDAFMKLIFTDYAGNLVEGLRKAGFDGDINFADSAATLMSWDFALENPYRLVFSGPSAGTASCVLLGEEIGDQNLICADVGGTSVDISVITEGQPFVNTDFEIEHDLLINTLSTEVVSLGAGGGSIVDINVAGELTVGPGSAGADPGPACYGKGGERPTVTDACLLIGILDDKGLLGGDMPLDRDLSRKAFEALPSQIEVERLVGDSFRMALNNVAEGVVDIAIRHGLDPRDYSLVAYGAAGPMLLPALMDLVQVRRVIVPPHPGLFSALGLLSSDLVYTDSRSSYVTLTEDTAPEIEGVFRTMEDSLLEKIDIDRSEVEIVRTLDAALLGQTWDTPFVPVPEGEITAEAIPVLIDNFHAHYERRYGNQFREIPVRGITYRVQIRSAMEKVTYPHLEQADGTEPEPIGEIELRCLFDEPVAAKVFQREELLAGHRIAGPAVIREELSTTYITPNQVATIGERGEILIDRASSDEGSAK